MARCTVARQFDCQPRLADSTRPEQRQNTRVLHQFAQFFKLRVAAQKRAEIGWQIAADRFPFATQRSKLRRQARCHCLIDTQWLDALKVMFTQIEKPERCIGRPVVDVGHRVVRQEDLTGVSSLLKAPDNRHCRAEVVVSARARQAGMDAGSNRQPANWSPIGTIHLGHCGDCRANRIERTFEARQYAISGVAKRVSVEPPNGRRQDVVVQFQCRQHFVRVALM